MPVKVAVTNPDEVFYNEQAEVYCRSLPLEHFMEKTSSGTQRKITLSSFDLIHAARPDVWCFNELLVQYPRSAAVRDIARVVPDNMVVIHDGPLRATGSFNTPFEAAAPFLVLEYVSDDNPRKDYEDNMRRYERDLRVPYYLLFEPEKQLLSLFRLPARGRKYRGVPANDADRMPIPELELEVATLDGWVRFWFRGKLLPLPADMMKELEEAKKRLRRVRREAAEAERRAATAEAELAKLRAEIERLKGG
jgi:Uma2 family endonuclease